MPKKKLLTGQDFCECPPCEERKDAIWPESVIDQIQMNDDSTLNLKQWITTTTSEEPVELEDSLLEWLQTNYPINAYSLPTASTVTKGGIKIDTSQFEVLDDVLSLKEMTFNWAGDSSYETFVTAGTLKGLFDDTVTTNITIPKPTVELSINSTALNATQKLGGVTQEVSSVSIGNIVDALGENNDFNSLFDTRWVLQLENSILKLYDSYTQSYTSTVNLPTYTASHGIVKEGYNFEHSNVVEAGTIEASYDSGALNIPIVNYDSNGHITSTEYNPIPLSNPIKVFDSSEGTDFFEGYDMTSSVKTSTISSEGLDRGLQLYLEESSNAAAIFDVIYEFTFQYPNAPSKVLYLKTTGEHLSNNPVWKSDTLSVSVYSRDFTKSEIESKLAVWSGDDKPVLFGGEIGQIRVGDFAKASGGMDNYIKKDSDEAYPLWYDEGMTSVEVNIYVSSDHTMNLDLTKPLLTWKNTGIISTVQAEPVYVPVLELEYLNNYGTQEYYTRPQGVGVSIACPSTSIFTNVPSGLTISDSKIVWTSYASGKTYFIQQRRNDIDNQITYFVNINECVV